MSGVLGMSIYYSARICLLSRDSKLTLIVGILLLIGALVAVPHVWRLIMLSKVAANASGSMDSLRTINRAEHVYAVTYPKVGFSPTLRSLGDLDCREPSLRCAGLIDSNLSSGVEIGYRYTYAPVPASKEGGAVIAYSVHADPIAEPGESSGGSTESMFGLKHTSILRHFFTDQTGVIRYESGREAGPQSPVLF
jgi:hypothetical protein